MATANQVLSIAANEIGYCRHDDPQTGTKYGRWYESTIDRCSTNYDFGGNGVPFCYMFVSWVMCQAGAAGVGIPGSYCPSGVALARSKGKLRSASTAKPGDMVYFDWEGDGTSDHIGIVEKNCGSYLQCIEGNTTLNGRSGCVARRTRNFNTIIGVVSPDYNGTSTAPTPAAQATKQANNNVTNASAIISVDGLWGKDTSRKLQAILKTTQDGIISDQYAGYRDKNPGLMSSSWEWKEHNGNGSDVIKAMQKIIGAEPDGCAGPETFTKLQKYLGTEPDGCISRPSSCVRALQTKLNSGKF